MSYWRAVRRCNACGTATNLDLIQVNLPVRPGDSGGPLARTARGRLAGLAVPVHAVKRFLKQALG